MPRLISYTPEPREEAVKLVLTQGLTLDDAALRLTIPKGTLANWVATASGAIRFCYKYGRAKACSHRCTRRTAADRNLDRSMPPLPHRCNIRISQWLREQFEALRPHPGGLVRIVGI